MATQDIGAFWDQYAADGSMGRIMQYQPKNNIIGGLLGSCFTESQDGKSFPSDNTDDPNYTCEIWIAVNEK